MTQRDVAEDLETSADQLPPLVFTAKGVLVSGKPDATPAPGRPPEEPLAPKPHT